MYYPVLTQENSFSTLQEIISLWVLGGVWSQGWNLKELTEGHHQEWSLRLNLTQHGKTHQVQTQLGLTDWELFLDSVGGGAWPFLVGGVICLVNSDNERDLSLLISDANDYIRKERVFIKALGLTWRFNRKTCFHLLEFWSFWSNKFDNDFLEGHLVFNQGKFEAITGLWCPLDVLGCTRATLIRSTSTEDLIRKDWVNFWNCIVLGIDNCNYLSWTRNS